MAEEQLEKCKKEIKGTGFTKHADTLEKRGVSVDSYFTPSQNWKEIKYYNLRPINKDIKQNFKQHLSKKLPEDASIIDLEGKTCKFSPAEWDKLMSVYINLQKKNAVTEEKKAREKEVEQAKEAAEMAAKEEKEAKATMKTKEEAAMKATKATKALETAKKELNSIQVAEKLVDKLQKTYDGLRFFQSQFPLFGFMRDDTDEKKMPKSYLWQGKADAIAFYNDRYVIVDFKTVDNILEYQQSAADLCGKHLHQCLIYAQLLKLHMNLDYLPPILIVVIDRVTGSLIYPPLFEKYPSDFEEKLKNFKWSKKEFSQKPPLRLRDDGKLFIGNTDSPVDKGKKLTEIFQSEATAKDLLDALGYGSLEITWVKKEKT